MGRTTEQVAVHKDRQLVSINLTISKLKGVGEDTLFIGIMQVSCSLNTTCQQRTVHGHSAVPVSQLTALSEPP
jgi:hypothetical protein